MRITQRGQVTIPEPIRRSAGLLPGTEVEFVQDRTGVRLRPVDRPQSDAAREARRRGARQNARQRNVKMTTEEIMALTRGE